MNCNWVIHALFLQASRSLCIGNGCCSWGSSSPHDLFPSCLMCSKGTFYCLLFKLCFGHKIIHFRMVFPWCSWQRCLRVSHALFPFPVILRGCWPWIISEERRQAVMNKKRVFIISVSQCESPTAWVFYDRHSELSSSSSLHKLDLKISHPNTQVRQKVLMSALLPSDFNLWIFWGFVNLPFL